MRFTVYHKRNLGSIMATPYVRAAGKPLCLHGTRCYRAAREHWDSYDHPEDHWRLSARGDIPPPRVPLTQFPGPVCVDISKSDDEEDGGTVSAQPGPNVLFDRGGLIHFRVASMGPQELLGTRRQIAVRSPNAHHPGAAEMARQRGGPMAQDGRANT